MLKHRLYNFDSDECANLNSNSDGGNNETPSTSREKGIANKYPYGPKSAGKKNIGTVQPLSHLERGAQTGNEKSQHYINNNNISDGSVCESDSDSMDEDDFFSKSNSNVKLPYTLQEDEFIIKFILKGRNIFKASSVSLWKYLESKKENPKRTYQSLKNRFLKSIKPKLFTTYSYLIKDKKTEDIILEKYPDLRRKRHMRKDIFSALNLPKRPQIMDYSDVEAHSNEPVVPSPAKNSSNQNQNQNSNNINKVNEENLEQRKTTVSNTQNINTVSDDEFTHKRDVIIGEGLTLVTVKFTKGLAKNSSTSPPVGIYSKFLALKNQNKLVPCPTCSKLGFEVNEPENNPVEIDDDSDIDNFIPNSVETPPKSNPKAPPGSYRIKRSLPSKELEKSLSNSKEKELVELPEDSYTRNVLKEMSWNKKRKIISTSQSSNKSPDRTSNSSKHPLLSNSNSQKPKTNSKEGRTTPKNSNQRDSQNSSATKEGRTTPKNSNQSDSQNSSATTEDRTVSANSNSQKTKTNSKEGRTIPKNSNQSDSQNSSATKELRTTPKNSNQSDSQNSSATKEGRTTPKNSNQSGSQNSSATKEDRTVSANSNSQKPKTNSKEGRTIPKNSNQSDSQNSSATKQGRMTPKNLNQSDSQNSSATKQGRMTPKNLNQRDSQNSSATIGGRTVSANSNSQKPKTNSKEGRTIPKNSNQSDSQNSSATIGGRTVSANSNSQKPKTNSKESRMIPKNSNQRDSQNSSSTKGGRTVSDNSNSSKELVQLLEDSYTRNVLKEMSSYKKRKINSTSQSSNKSPDRTSNSSKHHQEVHLGSPSKNLRKSVRQLVVKQVRKNAKINNIATTKQPPRNVDTAKPTTAVKVEGSDKPCLERQAKKLVIFSGHADKPDKKLKIYKFPLRLASLTHRERFMLRKVLRKTYKIYKKGLLNDKKKCSKATKERKLKNKRMNREQRRLRIRIKPEPDVLDDEYLVSLYKETMSDCRRLVNSEEEEGRPNEDGVGYNTRRQNVENYQDLDPDQLRSFFLESESEPLTNSSTRNTRSQSDNTSNSSLADNMMKMLAKY